LVAWSSPDGAGLEWLPRPAGQAVHVGRRLALVPWAGVASRPSSCLLLLAGREDGLLLEAGAQGIDEVFDDSRRAENRHQSGGWAQSKLQRWSDRTARMHLREVVEHLARVYDRMNAPPVLISAAEESRGAIRDLLPEELSAAVAGWLGEVGDWPTDRLREEVLAALDREAGSVQEALLARAAAQTGRGEGVSGAEAVLGAASEGRIEWLLLWPGQTVDASSCPSCGRLLVAGWQCPFDETPLVHEPDGLEALGGAVLRTGGAIWTVETKDGSGPEEPAVVTRW